MARARSGDLFLTIGGDVTPLRSAVKAGKSVLAEFGTAAVDIQKEVDRAFGNMAANAPSEAKKIEQSFAATFRQIRDNAKQVLNAPSGQAALQIFDVAGAQQAATAAQAEAAALRLAANAAIAADKAAGGTNASVRVLAVASETAAVEAEQHAVALRGQAQALELVAKETGVTAGSQQALTKSSGNARIAQLELLHSVRASVDQYAFGTPITQIFALQVAQVGQAAALAGDGLGKVGKFLGGPWGIAIIAATSILTTLIAKHGDAKKAALDHASAEDQLAAAARGEKIANDALIESLVKLNEQEAKSLQTANDAIRARYEDAKAVLAQAAANKALLETQLAAAKADLAAKQAAQGRAASGGKGAIEAASGDTSRTQTEVDRLQAAVDDQTKVIGQATALIDTELTRLARNLSTHVGRANDEFDKQLAALEAKYRGTEKRNVFDGKVQIVLKGGLLNQPGVNEPKRQQLLKDLTAAEEKLSVARAKAVDAAQKLDDAERGKTKTEKDSGGRAIFNEQIGAFFDAANRFRGDRGSNNVLREFFREANVGLDPEKQAWCAAFVNAVLASQGVKGTGSNGAPSFLNFGKDDTHSPQKGDIVVVKSPRAPSGEHVGFLESVDAKGNVVVLGGNTGGKVASAKFKASSVLAIRRPPTPSEAAAGAQSLADKTKDQEDHFAEAMTRLDEQLIAGRHELVQNVEAQARFATEQVEAERKAYELSIQDAVHDGRLREEQGKLLIERSNAVAAQRLANAAVQKFIRQQDELRKTEDQDYDLKRQSLEFQLQMARSSSERLKIARDIIDAEYAHRRNVLEIARKSATEAQNWDEVGRISKELADLPNQRARDQTSAANDNQSPWGRYVDSLPRNLDEVKDRLDEIKVTAMHELEDSAARAATKLLGLKGPLADIASMLLKVGFEALLGQVLPGLGGARASGGPVSPSKWYVVGENGPEIFVPDGSGTILPNSVFSARGPRSPAALSPANNNNSGPIEVTIGFGPAPEFAPYVQEVSAAHARQAVQVSVNHTNQTLRTLARPKLMGG